MLTPIKDDGTHIISCERCNVWQHSKCLGISKSAAEKEDFHFVCKDCRQKEEDARKPKISLKLRFGTSASPAPPSPGPTKSTFVGVEVPSQPRFNQGSSANGFPASPSQSLQRQQAAQINGVLPQQNRAQSGSPPNPQIYGDRPHPASYQAIQPYPMNNGQARSTMAAPVSSPSHPNAISYQYQNYPVGPRPLAPSPSPTHQTPASSSLPKPGRLPSPILNRPTISPTQGNMDVGPLVGIPERLSQSPQRAQNGGRPPINGLYQAQATPLQNHATLTHQTPISRTPNYPLSGLSPKKPPTPSPLPQGGHRPQKSTSMSPPLPISSTIPPLFPSTNGPSNPLTTGGAHPLEKRTVSGTPILPPVESLRPSPQQLRNSSSTMPVPTPSKQPQPQSHINEQAVVANGAFSVGSGDATTEQGLMKEAGADKDEPGAPHLEVRDLAMQDV